jgi:hypothetical protein
MKDFTRAPGRLRNLPRLARVIYSVFILFTLIALGFSAWLGADMVGADLARFDEYYAGAVPAASQAAPPEAPSGGPELELPDSLPEAIQADPIALRKLLEVTHFHLFSMPVYLMVLCHLFMLSRWSERSKLAWIAVSTLAVASHIAAPWLGRSGGPAARLFYAASGGLLVLGFGVLSVVPLVEMWHPRTAQKTSASGSNAPD